jgi:zinc protease
MRPRATCSSPSTAPGTRPARAILVIVGDIDPTATLEKVRQLFGAIPNHPTPAAARVELKPVKSESFTLDSNLPYTLAFIAYRFPGTSSPDYAAAEVLADVLSSQRADLYGMVPAGHALAAEFGLAEPYEKASVGYAVAALPAGRRRQGGARGDAQDSRELRASTECPRIW